MCRLLLIICFFLSCLPARAQTWETGLSAGAAGYMGDINQKDPLKFTDPAFGVLVRRNFDGYWSARLNFTHGGIRGDDAESSSAYQKNRNLNFRSELSELSLLLEFNLFNYQPGELPSYGVRRLSPFLFTGIAGIHFNPVTDYEGNEVELQPVQTEDVSYKRYALSIPYGAGVKYNIKGNFNLTGEIGYRTAFTDYLDDISGKYPDFNVTGGASSMRRFLSDPSMTAVPGSQRGDFRPRDTYMFAMISLTYTFVPVRCPTF